MMNSHDGGIAALTGLRFVAAFMVLIAHVAMVLPTGAVPSFLAQLAPLGMMLFFVLSGFVIWLNYAQPIASGERGALRGFAVARFARLYPMYLVVVLLALGMTSLLQGIAAVQHTFRETLYFISLLEAWVIDHDGRLIMLSVPYIMHLWSISSEVFFYAIFPFIAILLFKAKAPKTIQVIGLTNVMLGGITFYLVFNHFRDITSAITPRLSDTDAWNWLCYYSPYMRVFQFLSGCIAGHLYLTARQQPPTSVETRSARVLAHVAVIAFLMTIVLVNFCDLTANHFAYAVLLQVIPLVALPFLMFFLSRYCSGLGRLLSWRPIVVGGEVSYSIYLLHPFVLVGTKEMISRFLGPDVTGQLMFIITTVLLVGLISHATYRFVERPAKQWIRQKFQDPRWGAVGNIYHSATRFSNISPV
jgi:peptidoglycan/LPS O-acetylase OafA/YrhL